MKNLTRLLAITALFVLTACGETTTAGGGGSPSASGPSKVDSIASEVPSDMKSKGTLQAAVDATYPPNEFVDDSGNIVGWDIDLGNAIAKVMGLTVTWSKADFSSIIPGIGSRYDIGISSFSPTAEREKTVDFITYYKAGEEWFVKAGGPQVSDPSAMCGQTVTVETGTTEEADAYGYMGKNPDGSAIKGDANNCKTAGKPDITVHSFTKQTDSFADLQSGHSTIGWADQPVTDYYVKLSNGQLQSTGKPCSIAPYGFALAKGSPLEKAIQDALKYLIDNGFYTTILKKYGVDSGGIASTDVALNVNSFPNQPTCVPSY